MWRRLVGALVLTATLGCYDAHARSGGEGDDAGPPAPDAGDAELTLEDFARRHPALLCERVMRCAAPQDVSVHFELHPEAECLRYFRYLASDDLAEAAARGVLRYDAASARACLAELAHDCTFVPSERCERAVVGTLPIGGECGSTVECAPGAYCDGGDDDVRVCGGVCAAAGREGEACPSRGCGSGLACYADVCRRVRRVDREALEPCGDSVGADGALERAVCGPEHYCLRVCEPYPTQGAPCDPSGARFPNCAAGLACAQDERGVATCTRPVVATVEGAACDGVTRLCDRLDRLACVDGACARIGGEGGACEISYAPWDCDPGDRCEPSTETCVPLLDLAAPCSTDVECASTQCVAGRCVPPESTCAG